MKSQMKYFGGVCFVTHILLQVRADSHFTFILPFYEVCGYRYKERICLFYLCLSRLALEVKWWLPEQRLPPLWLWRQHCPGAPRPVSPSTASFLTERSSVTQRQYPPANTTMYFHVLFFVFFSVFYHFKRHLILLTVRVLDFLSYL